MTKALVVVDVQLDFCEKGSLPVSGGNRVAYLIADHIRHSNYDYVVATKDYHLADHDNNGHFGNPPDFVDSWPAHCVRGTPGAEFHPAIQEISDHIDAVFHKGAGKAAYSGFEGWHQFEGEQNEQLALHGWLQARGVTEIVVVGIAADHCVRATALDGVGLGYHVRVPLSLTCAVGGPEAKIKAIREVNEAQGRGLTKIN